MITDRIKKRINVMCPKSKKAKPAGLHYSGRGLPFRNNRNQRHFVKIRLNGLVWGHKNISCPHYDACLDAACKKNIIWMCNGCVHENNHKGEFMRWSPNGLKYFRRYIRGLEKGAL